MRHIVTLMNRVEREPGWACALRSEQLLAHSARVLGPAESLGAAKVLLVRAAGDPWGTPRTVDLVPVRSVQQWRHYEVQRIAVEAGFGVGESEARRMVGDQSAEPPSPVDSRLGTERERGNFLDS